MNARPLRLSLAVFVVTALTALSAARAAKDASPDTANTAADAAFPRVGYAQAIGEFKGFSYHARRDLSVSLNGLTQRRTDEVTVKRDGKGNVTVQQVSSEPHSNMEFRIVDQRATRLPDNKTFDPVATQAVFTPLVLRLTDNSRAFWEKFRPRLKWDRKGTTEFAGRACDRFEITANAATDADRFKAKGEILVDQKTNIVLKSNVTAHFFAEALGEVKAAGDIAHADESPTPEADDETAAPAQPQNPEIPNARMGKEPFDVTMRLSEEVRDLDRVK